MQALHHQPSNCQYHVHTRDGQWLSKLVFYAQSTITVTSGRYRLGIHIQDK